MLFLEKQFSKIFADLFTIKLSEEFILYLWSLAKFYNLWMLKVKWKITQIEII